MQFSTILNSAYYVLWFFRKLVRNDENFVSINSFSWLCISVSNIFEKSHFSIFSILETFFNSLHFPGRFLIAFAGKIFYYTCKPAQASQDHPTIYPAFTANFSKIIFPSACIEWNNLGISTRNSKKLNNF